MWKSTRGSSKLNFFLVPAHPLTLFWVDDETQYPTYNDCTNPSNYWWHAAIPTPTLGKDRSLTIIFYGCIAFGHGKKQIVWHGPQLGRIITVHFAYRRVVHWGNHCCIKFMGCLSSGCMNVMAEIFKQETGVCRYPKVNGETGNSSWSS